MWPNNNYNHDDNNLYYSHGNYALRFQVKLGGFAAHLFHEKLLGNKRSRTSIGAKVTSCRKVSRISVDGLRRKCFKLKTHKKRKKNEKTMVSSSC